MNAEKSVFCFHTHSSRFFFVVYSDKISTDVQEQGKSDSSRSRQSYLHRLPPLSPAVEAYPTAFEFRYMGVVRRRFLAFHRHRAHRCVISVRLRRMQMTRRLYSDAGKEAREGVRLTPACRKCNVVGHSFSGRELKEIKTAKKRLATTRGITPLPCLPCFSASVQISSYKTYEW